MSPTQRTLRELRNMGRLTDIVEKFNMYAGPHGQRKDLFNIIDLISLDPERGIIGVQCCARSGHAAHRKKILEQHNQETYEWLRCGGKLEIWSWGKQKVKLASGGYGKAFRWKPKVEEITLEHTQ